MLKIIFVSIFFLFIAGCSTTHKTIISTPIKEYPIKTIEGTIKGIFYKDEGYCYEIKTLSTGKFDTFCYDKYNKYLEGDIVEAKVQNDRILSLKLLKQKLQKPNPVSLPKIRKIKKRSISLPKNETISFD